jgi:alpha-glucosidase
MSLDFSLQPHHDGSVLYIPNQKPKLLEKVKVRVRVHPKFEAQIGKLAKVIIRQSENGEAFLQAPAKLLKTNDGWLWFEAQLTMYNPSIFYRWCFVTENDDVFWLNTLGFSDMEQPDINDFRINVWSSGPTWGPGTIMYQIFPDRFARSKNADKHKLPEWAVAKGWGEEVTGQGYPTSEQFFGGDLWGVIEHLDHLKKLGVTMIYLTPFFPAGSNHRYDASSFNKVDPLLGGDKALIALVEAAHKMGFKVIGDLTSNHSGDKHEWFTAAYKNPKAPESDFYYFTDKNTKYESWWGVPSLPKFNWNSQELRKRFIQGKSSVVAKWLKAPYNLDGWRIDVANMTGRIRDEDMSKEVARIVRETMHELNPNTILLGEYTGDPSFEVQGDGWQGAMTYANFTKPLWRWMANPQNKGFITYMGIGARHLNGMQFVETHKRFIASFPWHVRQHNMNALDTHDIPRFKTFTRKGAQRVGAGLQFTFPGIPVVWAGDEFGLDGFNGENSRTPLPWNNERPHDTAMIETYAQLAAIRKTNPALVEGGMRFLYASKEAIVFIREHKKQSVLVAATRGKDDEIKFDAASVFGAEQAVNLFGGGKLKVGKKYIHLPGDKMAINIWSLPAAK